MATIKNYELKVKRVALADGGVGYGTTIRQPSHAAEVARAIIGDSAQEVFIVLFVDVKNRVTGYTEAARGGVSSCGVDPSTVFRTAVILGATGIVVSHCHPSGDPEPSDEDKRMTKRLQLETWHRSLRCDTDVRQ